MDTVSILLTEELTTVLKSNYKILLQVSTTRYYNKYLTTRYYNKYLTTRYYNKYLTTRNNSYKYLTTRYPQSLLLRDTTTSILLPTEPKSTTTRYSQPPKVSRL